MAGAKGEDESYRCPLHGRNGLLERSPEAPRLGRERRLGPDQASTNRTNRGDPRCPGRKKNVAGMSTDSEKFSLKIPLALKCSKCKEPASPKIHLDQTSFDWTCPKCGFVHPSLFGLDVTIGFLLLERSRYELITDKDFSMSIVMSAMAFEAELSRLFGKCKQIDALRADQDFDREACEKELRDFGNIDRKIDKVSQFLVNKGIDVFVSGCAELSDPISTRFQSIRLGSLTKDFHKNWISPRTQILYRGA